MASPQDKIVEEPHHFIQVDTPNAIGGDSLSIEAPQLTLEWRDLNLQVKVKNSKTKDVETKKILSDVSGTARPGELLVIMGPSGAGKSSLLDCIAGRNVAVQGSIALNGAPWSKRMKRFSAYVMQDDLFYETITVREHLLFQARLRMGGKFSPEQYTKRVDTVIEELGLSKCRDTYIGGAMLRGISGGERKRLSFATEILTNPSLLFVDEPTSGLDSYMAETVVMQLQQLARDGRTVIATIHQPSSELFTLFDKLYLLADGATVYSGNASDAVEYFAKLGLQCPSFVNPTDFFMRQLVVLDVEKDEVGANRVQLLKDEWAKTARNDRHGSSVPVSTTLASPGSSDNDTEDYEDARLGSVGQLAVLMQRNVLRLVRDRIRVSSGCVPDDLHRHHRRPHLSAARSRPEGRAELCGCLLLHRRQPDVRVGESAVCRHPDGASDDHSRVPRRSLPAFCLVHLEKLKRAPASVGADRAVLPARVPADWHW
ncbi:hypothetical protein PINS_up020203 [Pythium insidiosum]|nr:hypothetical protein PINS_up020203 [Pythium insidiosum]